MLNQVQRVESLREPMAGDYELVEDEGIDLRHYWRVVWKHRWGIMASVLAVALLTALYAWSLTPIYRSTATLLIGTDNSVMGDDTNRSAYAYFRASREFQTTQVEILRSRETAEAALARLELTPGSKFDPLVEAESTGLGLDFDFDWRRFVPEGLLLGLGLGEVDAAEQGEDAAAVPREKRLLGWLRSNLTIEAVKESKLVRIAFESPDPVLAAMVANTVAEAYVQEDLDQRISALGEASQWLSDQLATARQTLAESQRKLQAYREEVGLVEVSGMQSVYTEQLKRTTADLAEARRARTQAENQWRETERMIAAGDVDNLTVVRQSADVQRLRTRAEELEFNIASDQERYSAALPRIERMRRDLAFVQNELQRTVNAAAAGLAQELENAYRVALANEQRLVAQLSELENKVQGLNRKEFQLEALRQEVATNQQFYEALLERFTTTSAGTADTVSVIGRLVEPAIPETLPVKPRKQRMVLVAVLLTLMAGVGLAFLLDKLDNTIKSRDDVDERLGLPVLTEVDLLDGRKSRDRRASTIFRDQPDSITSEAIRTLRTSVVLGSLGEPQPIVLVTSTVSGEGKSTVAANLALALAQLGKVLLVDADMRRPTVARSFALDAKSAGLSDVVAGTTTLDEAVHHVEGGLDVLTAGTMPPDPLEVMSNSRFSELLETLRERYERVIIDSAPVEVVSDARVLASKADAVIYVVKADDTPHPGIRAGLKNLDAVGTPVMGVVLNQLDPDKHDAYGKYGKYSKYGRKYARYGYSQTAEA